MSGEHSLQFGSPADRIINIKELIKYLEKSAEVRINHESSDSLYSKTYYLDVTTRTADQKITVTYSFIITGNEITVEAI